MNFWKIQISAAVVLASLAGSAPAADRATVQFWGDTFVNWQMTVKHREKSGRSTIFGGVAGELAKAEHNVINFEGVATGARYPFVLKRFLLPMPLFVDRVLAQAGIGAATLANNHALDYGKAGLFDTLATLKRSRIQTAGAGLTAQQANLPMILSTRAGSVCILNYSRTLPSEHWARGNHPGTANLNFTKTGERIAACARTYDYTFVVYHWGAESSHEVKSYQRRLARLSIDHGATAVIGHHPHVLQPVEIYRNRPILYSLGNFAFASNPNSSSQQGAGARFYFNETGLDKMKIVPLKVSFREVKGRPELFPADVASTYLDKFVTDKVCAKKGAHGVRTCLFKPNDADLDSSLRQ